MLQLLSAEQAKSFLVEKIIGRGNDIPAFRGASALPCSHASARSFNDRDEGGNVVGLETGLDNAVHVASSKHGKGITIRAIAGQPRPRLHSAESFDLAAAELKR